LSEQEKQRHVSHVARNPEAVGAKRDRLALCGRVVPARALTVQPSAENCCAKCRKAWLRWCQLQNLTFFRGGGFVLSTMKPSVERRILSPIPSRQRGVPSLTLASENTSVAKRACSEVCADEKRDSFASFNSAGT
jgi:hypothetical protein